MDPDGRTAIRGTIRKKQRQKKKRIAPTSCARFFERTEKVRTARDSTVLLPPRGDSWFKLYSLPPGLHMTPEDFERLWKLQPEERSKAIFGKTVPRGQRMFTSSGSDTTYSFTGAPKESSELVDPFLLKLMEWVNQQLNEKFTKFKDHKYSLVLMNCYANGGDYIGAHKDDEPGIVPNSPIFGISFGQTRKLRITSTHTAKIDVLLENNSVFVMGGRMQEEFKHGIVKQAVSVCPNRRISFTFRLHQ